MSAYLDTFERIITHTLIVMMAGVVLLATVELAWLFGKDISSIAALVFSLALGYSLVRRSLREKGDIDSESKG